MCRHRIRLIEYFLGAEHEARRSRLANRATLRLFFLLSIEESHQLANRNLPDRFGHRNPQPLLILLPQHQRIDELPACRTSQGSVLPSSRRQTVNGAGA